MSTSYPQGLKKLKNYMLIFFSVIIDIIDILIGSIGPDSGENTGNGRQQNELLLIFACFPQVIHIELVSPDEGIKR